MWRLVREGLRFYRPATLISWAVGTGIYVLILALLTVDRSFHSPDGFLKTLAAAALQLPVAILIASMVAGFIVVGTEAGERRLRLHLTLPLTVDSVAWARVLLPTAVLLSGLAISHVIFAVLLALNGEPALGPRQLNLDAFALSLLFWVLIVPAIKEVLVARTTGTVPGAVAGATVLVALAALVIWVQVGPLEGKGLQTAITVGLDLVLMVFVVGCFQRRSQFT